MKTNSIDAQTNREALTATVAEWALNRWPDLELEELQSNLPLLQQVKKADETCKNCADPAVCRSGRYRWNAELRDGRLRAFTEACGRKLAPAAEPPTERTNMLRISDGRPKCRITPGRQRGEETVAPVVRAPMSRVGFSTTV